MINLISFNSLEPLITHLLSFQELNTKYQLMETAEGHVQGTECTQDSVAKECPTCLGHF